MAKFQKSAKTSSNSKGKHSNSKGKPSGSKGKPSSSKGKPFVSKGKSFVSKGKPPMSKGNSKTKPLSKNNFNKKNKKTRNQRNQDHEQTQHQNPDPNVVQNAYGVIEKQKLLSMSCEKQLQTLKDLHARLIEKPQQNVKHLDAIFLLTKVSNLKVVAHALRTLADIFVNVAPLEAISVKGLEERTENKITKDEFVVIKFERILAEQYERYIKTLKELKVKLKSTDFNNDQELFTEFKKCILQCALTCFKTLWSFNFAKELCDLLLHFIKFKECQSAFQSLLKDQNIATVSVKVKIINGIAQLIKKKEDRELPNDLIKILNSTYIDTRYLEKDRDALDFKKKKAKKRLYRQEAFQKKVEKQKGKEDDDKLAQKRKKKQEKIQIKMKIKDEIDKQFAEGEAIISNKVVVKNNSFILQELFYVYFKVLVEKLDSKFLKDALDGILKFAHFINIDLISSMLDHLDRAAKIFREIWKKTPTNENLEKRLIIVFTMEGIINGPLSVYSMDDLSVSSNFYKIFRDINHVNNQSKVKFNKDLFRLFCITIEECFIKRRQLSQQIVGSFLREISIFILRADVPKLYLLEVIRLLASKYGKVSRMFEEDNEGYGINSYNQGCEDPQSTNAIYTEILSRIFSLKKFNKYSKGYIGQIQEYVTRLARQNFLRVEGTQSLENMLKDDLEVGF